MEQLLVGIGLALIGIFVAFFGLRFWYLLLPLFGAVVGFFIGARLVQELLGTGFLSTVASWVVGIVFGVLFALVSWYVWYLGVILIAGALGAMLASGLLHALFAHPWGWVLVLVTVIGAVIFAGLAVMMHAPSYIIIVASAFAGAALAVAGVMTLLGMLTVGELANGVGIAVIDEAKSQDASWVWILGWLVLGAIGVAFQLQRIAEARLPDERWVRAQSA
jgi:hypothetical protein